MSNASLCTFAEKVRANNRIRFGDLRRLQRDVLPRGLSCREDAELLLGLDRAIKKTDEGWPAYLATLVKDFVIADLRSTGLRRPPDGAVAHLLVGREPVNDRARHWTRDSPRCGRS